MVERTRRDIRRSLGYDLAGIQPGALDVRTYSDLTVNTLTDESQVLAANEGVGRWIVLNNGHIARVTEYNDETHTFTFSPAYSPVEDPINADDDTYELWTQEVRPHAVNDIINQAIVDATTVGVYEPVTLDRSYLPPLYNRIKSPEDWAVLRSVEYCTRWSFTTYSLRGSLAVHPEGENNDTFFPFHTVKLQGSGILAVTDAIRPGTFDSVGWEVAGDFVGKPGQRQEWGFVRQDFDPFNVSYNSEGHALIPYDAGTESYVLDAYLYHEKEVLWQKLGFIVWPSTEEIELPEELTTSWGYRLRLHGGKALSLMDSDDDTPPVPASYIRARGLVSLLRSKDVSYVDPGQQIVRQEWEVTARREYAQLPKMQNTRKLR